MKLFILMTIAAAAMAAEPVRVGMAVRYPVEMGAATRVAFEQETTAAMAEAGVELVWGARAGEAYDRVVVVRFKDGCADQGRGRALGLTHISDGRVLPFVEMECGRVRQVIGEDGEMLGRGLGRVAAHEIHHVLTSSGLHDAEGLTKAVFTRRDLWSREMRFSTAALERMRASLQQGGGGEQRASAEE